MISVGSRVPQRLGSLLTGAEHFGGVDVALGPCSDDAARIEPGQIYVAVVRADRDGHDAIAQAVRRGAAAVVCERFVRVPVPVYVVADSREALGRLHHAWQGDPSQSLFTVAVTGRHGKTCTAELATSVLRVAGLQAASATNLSTSRRRATALGYPRRWTSGQLAARLAEWQQAGGNGAVLECDHASLLERRLAGLALDAAVVTDLSAVCTRRQYLDNQAVQQTLERLACLLKPERPLVVCADEPNTVSCTRRFPCPVVTFGLSPEADVWGKLVDRDGTEQTFLLTVGNETVAVRTPTIGDWWLRHCLAAAAVARVAGVSLTEIAWGLEQARLPLRLQRLVCGQPFGVYVDVSNRPERMLEMLRTLREITRRRLWCVFALPDATTAAERAHWGRIAERFSDRAILTALPTPQHSLLEIFHDVLDGYHRPARAHLIVDRQHALKYVCHRAEPGDAVLITFPLETLDQHSSQLVHEELDGIQTILRCLDTTYEAPDDSDRNDVPVIYKFPSC